MRTSHGIHVVLSIVVMLLWLYASSVMAQQGPKVATVRGDASASNHIMLEELGETVDDYLSGANLWAERAQYWLIWIGWSNSNATVRNDFKNNGEVFQQWLADGGAFVGTTFSSNMEEVYELLPGYVRTNNAHNSIEVAKIVAHDHPIVNVPNDITDDAYYSNWAWTAGDVYTDWDGYIVIASRDGDPNDAAMWLVHESMPVVVTTMQPTWSGHMKPDMVENIWHYVKTWSPLAVQPAGKVATTWAGIKTR